MMEKQLSLLSSSLSKPSLDVSDNSNIGHSFLGMHELHLNEHGAGKLAFNFVKRIGSISDCNGTRARSSLTFMQI